MFNEAENPKLPKAVVMPFFYYRITNAFKLGFWVFKNPNIFRKNNFEMLSDLLGLIIKVSTEDRHIMTHLAYVHPEEGEKQIVSIWAGAGIGADPPKRISELLKENSALKSQLLKYIDSQNEA